MADATTAVATNKAVHALGVGKTIRHAAGVPAVTSAGTLAVIGTIFTGRMIAAGIGVGSGILACVGRAVRTGVGIAVGLSIR